MSALRNMPVICQGRQIGLLQSISLDEAQKRVYTLIVSCGLRGKQAIVREDVRSMAEGFILVEKAVPFKRVYERNGCRFIRDTTGLLVGYACDYAIDTRTLDILAVEMRVGHWPFECEERFWIYAYHVSRAENDADLIIPSSLGSERIFSREGDKICAYPP